MKAQCLKWRLEHIFRNDDILFYNIVTDYSYATFFKNCAIDFQHSYTSQPAKIDPLKYAGRKLNENEHRKKNEMN